MIIIGDVHGGGKVKGLLRSERKLDIYFNIIRGLKQKTIQLGDLGFKEEHEWFLKNVNTNQHKVLFGNHDHLPMVHERHSLGDYALLENNSIMAIRGAYSIDKGQRTEGLDWFHDEELSMAKCDEVLTMVDRYRPRVILSHDCPTEIAYEMHGHSIKTRTDQLLQACFERHQPELWIFAHHHRSWNKTLNGTRFVCLAELEVMEI